MNHRHNWMEPKDITADEFLALFTDKDTKFNHDDGAFVLFADGSVRFLTKDTPPSTIKALLTSQAGDVPGEVVGR